MHPRVESFSAGELWAVTLDKACVIRGAYRLTRAQLAPVPGLVAHLLRLSDADGACRVVLVHKDIAGPGALSGEVLALTTELCALCRAVGIEILDQLVFDVRIKYTSLRKRGFFDPHRWRWSGSIYPTMSDLERHRLRNERMGHVRRRAKRLPRDKAPVVAEPLPPLAHQAASWVRARLQGACAPELWVVVADKDGCICGGYSAGKPDSAGLPGLLAGILVRTKHLGSPRIVLVEGRVPSAALPGGHPEWAAGLPQAAQSVGLEIIDRIFVGPGENDCRVSR
jgi:hypothetical protein